MLELQPEHIESLGMRAVHLLMAFAVLALAACSKPTPPVGKWEGGTERGGVLVVARVEILPSGLVRVMAPDITNAAPEQIPALRERLAADLVNGWADVAPREMDFDGKTFRWPDKIAPQMVWDKNSNQMILQLYIGANKALPVPLRPVSEFHDSPWGQG